MRMTIVKISRKDSKIIFLALFIPLAVLLGVVLVESIRMPKNQYFFEIRKKASFHGVIDSVYRQSDNHNVMTVTAKGQLFEIERIWESKFIIGDSVSKYKDSLTIELYRDGKLMEILDYNDLLKD